ncbi:MAG: hypothetical protein M1388_03210 [Thaumarchaeota archaeon]|nr:hypothetical protein [Nitrososphaerota archaeon]
MNSSSGSLDQTFISRLIKAKAAYRYGQLLFKSGMEIEYGLSLILMDNSIEQVAAAALDYTSGANWHEEEKSRLKRELSFMDFIKKLNKVNLDISKLDLLHKSRNMAQHHGITPSKVDMELYSALTYNTLQEISKSVFSRDFNSISQAALIKRDDVRELYALAEKDYYEGRFEDCIIRTGAAFQIAKKLELSRLYGKVGPLNNDLIDFDMKEPSENIKRLFDVVKGIRKELDILELGLDFKKYQMFMHIFNYKLDEWTPMFDGTEFKSLKVHLNDSYKGYKDNQLETMANFSLLYAIEPILRWESTPRDTILDEAMRVLITLLAALGKAILGTQTVANDLKK